MPAVALLASALMVTSCDDDDNNGVAKAVLASSKTLTFDGIGADPQIITVYSDAQWTADVPEWVVITPNTGTGTTEVTISVSDNLREGTLDNPRKGSLVFHGNTLASRAEVTVRQLGDNYRDCPVHKAADLNSIADEAYIGINSLLVTLPIDGGFVATDDNGANNIVVKTSTSVSKGDVVTINAQKFTDERKLAFVTAEKVNIDRHGETVVYPQPVDLTETLDKYTGNKREYIKVEGLLASGIVTVGDAKLKVATVDNVSIDLDALNGHFVCMYGYFAGIAEPYLNIQPTALDDLGEALTIYWSEDFEWFEPWTSQEPSGRTIEDDNIDAVARQLSTDKYTIDGKEVSVYDAMLAKGYEFPICRHSSKSERKPNAQIYLQRNYLKMGLTGYYSGLTLPEIPTAPGAGTTCFISFDWSTMRQGSGVMDPTSLVVIVKNGTDEVQYSVPAHGIADNSAMRWVHAEIELTDVTIDDKTRITVRNSDDQWPHAEAKALRWFIDNVRIYSKL